MSGHRSNDHHESLLLFFMIVQLEWIMQLSDKSKYSRNLTLLLNFPLWITPNRCCSSTTAIRNAEYSIFSAIRLWVPIINDIAPLWRSCHQLSAIRKTNLLYYLKRHISCMTCLANHTWLLCWGWTCEQPNRWLGCYSLHILQQNTALFIMLDGK